MDKKKLTKANFMSSSTALLIKWASLKNEESLDGGVDGCFHMSDGEITAPKFDAVIKLSTSNLSPLISTLCQSQQLQL